MREKQLPQQNNIYPLFGREMGKPVRLNPNFNGYTGGKLADLPMYNKSSDKDPVPALESRTVVQRLSR